MYLFQTCSNDFWPECSLKMWLLPGNKAVPKGLGAFLVGFDNRELKKLEVKQNTLFKNLDYNYDIIYICNQHLTH